MSDSPAGESAFERLPVEILLEIANHCDLTDIFTLREVRLLQASSILALILPASD
jgi:hypothetical protein